MIQRLFFPAALCVAALLLLGSATVPALIEVRQDGYGDATTVAQGILLSSPGEEIRITDAATYNESGLVLGGNRRLTSVPVGATIHGTGVVLTLGGGPESNRVEGLTVRSNTICIFVFASDDGAPQIINTSVIGDNTLVTGIEVRNEVSSLSTPATVTLADVTFNTLGIGLRHTNAGLGNVAVQAACTYAATALDFSVIGGTAILFNRPASGTFSGILADGLGTGAVIEVGEGARFSNLSFSSINALNFFGTGVYVNEDNVSVTIDGSSFAGGQYGLRIGDLLTPLTGRATVNVLGATSFTGASNNAIRIEAPVILNLGPATLTATGTTFPAGVGLYAPDLASGVSLTANGTIFQNNGTRSLYAVSGSVAADANSAWSFTDCRFLAGATGEVFFDASFSTGNTVSFDRCLFRENASRPGGGNASIVLNGLPATFVNCILDLNANGGIAEFGSQALTIDHTTFAAPAAAAVVAISKASGAITLRNSIVDLPSGGVITGPATWTELNNCVRGLVPAHLLPLSPGSVVADPLFTVPSTGSGTGNFVPVAGSPCPGLGDPGVGVAVDFDGNARPNPVATDPDAGAYETILVPVELSAYGLD